jgi:hypothetical protein
MSDIRRTLAAHARSVRLHAARRCTMVVVSAFRRTVP